MDIDEITAEAERLARLSRDDQQEVIALHRSVANDPWVSASDRAAAKRRADRLVAELKRIRRKGKNT